MRNWLKNSLRIRLSRTSVTLVETTGIRRPRINVLAHSTLSPEECASPELLAAHLRSALIEANCSRGPTAVVLADDWVRLFVVSPPQNAMRLQDCQAAAAMRFQLLYGEALADWKISADWDAHQPFLACAIPLTLLGAIHQVATEQKLDLIQVTPQFIAAWNCWHKDLNPSSWFGVVRENLITLGVVDQNRLCAVHVIKAPSDGWRDEQWLSAQLTRDALGLNVAVPGELQLCGDVPAQWSSDSFGALISTRVDPAERALYSVPILAALATSSTRFTGRS